MSRVGERDQIATSSSSSSKTLHKSPSPRQASVSKPRVSSSSSSKGSKAVHTNGKIKYNDMASQPGQVGQRRVGVLPLIEGALDVGDDGRAIIWLDIDNTLYGKGTEISKMMTERIREYIIGLGLEEEEAERLHQKYYKEYGLAIRGLVMHHKIDALDYDSKCDATLPLETVLRPDQNHKEMLRNLDRSKCRVWALTNAYKTHAVKVLKLLELYDSIEGVIYCDYAQERFACKPEREFYDAALEVVGLKDPSRCYFVDDSKLNITAARKLGWGHCVLYSETKEETDSQHPSPLRTSVFLPDQSKSSKPGKAFNKELIQKEIGKLSQQERVELLDIMLETCLPGDVITVKMMLEKRLRLSSDMFKTLPDEVALRIFERLNVKELLNCQRVSKEWRKIASNPLLWKSHALGLTEGDPVGLIPPSDPSGWELLVRGLYFRERNWSKGISQDLTLMQGHSGFVTAMKLKGRKTLVTGSYDETIRVWDLYTGVCKKVLTAKAISSLDFLDEEGILAAGLYDTGRVMVWDMKTWTLLQTLSGHNRGIRNVAISKDFLVSVGQDKAIVVWDWKSGTKVTRFGQQSNVSLGVSLIDGDKIVAVTVDGIIRTFCIQKKEMIGQFDLARLSPDLACQLSGLKEGTLMMQWFAAHRNTLTLASQNLVIHLKWQEHIVPITPNSDGNGNTTPQRFKSRPRSDSLTSNTSTASNMTNRSTSQRKTEQSMTTPTKSKTNNQPALSSSHSSNTNLNRLMTPSRFQSPSRSPKASSPIASPVPWPKPPSMGGKARLSQTGIEKSPSSPIGKVKDLEIPSFSIPSSPNMMTSPAQTRIAPNLTIAPVVTEILQTPDAATGCVDPAKKRIVLATRFSSRAGADRRLYTSTLDSKQSNDGARYPADSVRRVVPVGGVWQTRVSDLAIPARNPMSIVLDHENCVVGTSEGLVYRLGFVGSEYDKGWQEEEKKEEEEKDGSLLILDSDQDQIEKSIDEVPINEDGSKTINNLLQLRQVWKHLFVS